ncbi:hypothetical protein WJX79_008648 [Trebouxia sp. C0005]
MRLLESSRKQTRVASPHKRSATTGSDRSVLEAFFLGRAFAETVNDRLGAALGDLLSEIAKADAERRQAWKSQPQNSSASQLLLQETVDDVRAEVASARAVLQQYKASKNQGTA